MSERLFGRNIALQFGKKTETERVQVTGLNMNFKVEKTSESSPNTASVTVYNLKETNRRLFEKTKDLEINLLVGYGEVLEQIFTGDVTKAVTERSGPDWLTTIEAGDGDKAIKEATLDKGYKAGTSYKTIIQDAANSLKETADVAIGAIGAVKDEIAQNGFSFSGLASTVLDNITKKQGLEWSVQDNELVILEPDKPTAEEAVFLSMFTGLVGAPKPREDGLDFKNLIRPRIKPGQLVQIESDTASGNYRVRKAIIEGESRGQKWYDTCEALEVA